MTKEKLAKWELKMIEVEELLNKCKDDFLKIKEYELQIRLNEAFKNDKSHVKELSKNES